MLLNWHQVEQAPRGVHKNYFKSKAAAVRARKEYPKSRRTAPLSKSRLLFAISILVILSATVAFAALPSSTPSRIPSPPSTIPSSLASSSSPTVIVSPGDVSVATVGSTFTIQIKVQNMDQFNGWDIEVYAYSTVINATSMSITGNDFAVNASSGSPFEIVHCVNGKGTGCTSTDGPGVVHSAYGNTAILTGNGLLFTITYQVTSIASYSPIELQNDLISSPSSGNGVPHVSISGSYGVTSVLAGGGGRHLLEI